MHLLFKKAFTVLIVLVASAAFSQEAVLSSGGNATGSGGTSSYSIGQPFYETTQEAGFAIAEGVQQPLEIVPLAVENPNPLYEALVVYPNPAAHIAYIQFDTLTHDLSYTLYDVNGRIIGKTLSIDSLTTAVPIENLTEGIYFLKIASGNEIIKSFKIIKNNQ